MCDPTILSLTSICLFSSKLRNLIICGMSGKDFVDRILKILEHESLFNNLNIYISLIYGLLNMAEISRDINTSSYTKGV